MPEPSAPSSPFAQAVALGFISGMRSMMGPAAVSRLAPPTVKIALRLMAAGELIVDKLPQTPSRLDPGPLAARALSGAAVGYVVCRHARRSPWTGVLLGAVAAVAGAYGGYHARKSLGERLHLPDPVVALAEDALAVGIAYRFAP